MICIILKVVKIYICLILRANSRPEAGHPLFDARPHELTQCAGCGETHDCALVPTGVIAMGRPVNEQLVALCASCYIPKRWRTRYALAAR